jgi:myo-inositol-1(or 4)-monophosphatase
VGVQRRSRCTPTTEPFPNSWKDTYYKNMEPTLTDVETLARNAGEILRAGYGRRHQINHKGLTDLVTEIDQQSEAYLLGEIRRRFPSHSIMAEESGAWEGQECCQWHVDPLDGTVNYAHGVPFFSVSIAYQEGSQVQLGAVYDPLRDELFSAECGQGAWLNGKQVQPSQATDLNQCLLVTGFPYDIRTRPEKNLNNYARFSMRSQGVRRLGSAALDLCYVAAGRLDGYWEMSVNSWDVAAGGLIAEQAGALVTKADGDPNFLTPPFSILAANRDIHPLMLNVLLESARADP